MNSNEFRSMAREKLQNRWKQAAIIMLVYGVCIFAISFILGLIPLIGQIANWAISPVLTFGLLKQFIKFKNNEEVGYADFFLLGFENFVMVWKVVLSVFLKLLAPLALVVVGGVIATVGTIVTGLSAGEGGSGISFIVGIILIIAGAIWGVPISYKYICATNELAYDPNRNAKDIVEQTANYMVGNRIKMFVLQLSFIGWIILASFTCGIGYLWLAPYMQIATILFYEAVSGRLNSYGPVNSTVISEDGPIH